MAERTHRIVPAHESDIHDEPHVVDSRVTVRLLHELVEEAGVSPREVASRYDLQLADVYHALAYYHEHPAEMQRVERDREQAIEASRGRAVTSPADAE